MKNGFRPAKGAPGPSPILIRQAPWPRSCSWVFWPLKYPASVSSGTARTSKSRMSRNSTPSFTPSIAKGGSSDQSAQCHVDPRQFKGCEINQHSVLLDRQVDDRVTLEIYLVRQGGGAE